MGKRTRLLAILALSLSAACGGQVGASRTSSPASDDAAAEAAELPDAATMDADCCSNPTMACKGGCADAVPDVDLDAVDGRCCTPECLADTGKRCSDPPDATAD